MTDPLDQLVNTLRASGVDQGPQGVYLVADDYWSAAEFGLEALHERGKDPVDLIAKWQDGDIGKLSLGNWLLQAFTWIAEQFRPMRMRPQVDAAFKDMLPRLGPKPDNASDSQPEED